MTNARISIVSDKKNKLLKDNLIKFLLEKKINIVELGSEESSDILVECKKVQLAIKNKQIDRAIVIDDYGIVPFMYLSKNKNFVVAEIADEHSAIMTADHNGSNILSFGSKISTPDIICNMAILFLNKKYSGGRHQSRIDMMNDLLVKEA